MARALVLWGLVGAVAAYGGDYGARLPLYDEPPARAHDADYQAHSPDAPASLDYKYEEDTRGKTEQSSVVEATENEYWQRPVRKYAKRADDDLSLHDMEKFDIDDDVPKRKSGRFTRHRSRLKSRKFERNNDYSSRYSKSSRAKHNDDSENDDEMSVGEYAEDNRRRFRNELHQVVHRTTSERTVRRKPRDEYMQRKSEDEDIERAEMAVDREIDSWKVEQQEARGQRRRPSIPRLPSSDDEPVFRPRPQSRQRNNYNEYDDEYYDMKRVMNMKNKLPTLMPRTQARSLVPAPLLRPMEELLANRRLFPAAQPRATITEYPDLTPTPTATSLATSPASVPTTITTTARPTFVVKSTAVVNISKELSLAEKSRLSILKKAQRKESLRSEVGTSKPPVLLQVTVKMPTMVVVEPPTSAHPWMRARAVTEDSPRRLRRVKQLMRHKLLANARSINDLTDNWDDLVCDYVDMSLLDSGAHLTRRPSVYISVCLLAQSARFI